jgi:hypothetical protein
MSLAQKMAKDSTVLKTWLASSRVGTRMSEEGPWDVEEVYRKYISNYDVHKA